MGAHSTRHRRGSFLSKCSLIYAPVKGVYGFVNRLRRTVWRMGPERAKHFLLHPHDIAEERLVSLEKGKDGQSTLALLGGKS